MMQVCRMRYLGGALAALSFLVPSVSSAGLISVGTWYQFSFEAAGSMAEGCLPADPSGLFCSPSSGTLTSFAPAPAWTFALGSAGTLAVTDAFTSGDRFEVFDFGVSMGFTSLPSATGAVDCGSDPVPCLANPAVSHELFALGAGAHSITIRTALSPSGFGSAYFQVDGAQVPEPASLTLLTTALGIALRARRRR